jgi:3D (Asp-Asp-Asp) domain-containing protein
LGLVDRKVKVEKVKAPFATHTDYTDTLNAGEIIDVEQGKDGLEERETEAFYLNGEEAFEKVLKSKVLVPTKNAKVLEGTALKQKLYPLKKRARVWKTITLEATAYYPGPEDTWPYTAGYTASGLKAGYGVVAVDPRIIRLKTPIYVEGYGYAIAADKGGAIKGSKIDLCFDTYEEAVRFGRKKVKVYLLR